ncbi:hypothetical protein ACF0H5_006126 [Mactra antiquata]
MVKYLFCLLFIGSLDCQRTELNHLRYGYRMECQSVGISWNISLQQCKDECRSRRSCKSFNYFRSVLLCELNNDDIIGTPNNLTETILSVYGQKIDWKPDSIISDCDWCSDSEKCEIFETGTSGCHVSECQSSLPVYANAYPLGNLRHVGALVRYTCETGYILFGNPVIECHSAGNWSVSEFKCTHKQCFTPTIDSIYELIDVTVELESVKLYIQCTGNYMTRGSPLTCEDGNYDFRFICCDEPEQDWVKIYNINSGEEEAPIALLYSETYEGLENENNDAVKNCQFRRYDIIRDWESLNISQVKIQVKINNTVHAWVIFDGVGSTNTNWLSKERLISSSWTDLPSIESFAAYGVNGHYETDVLLRFVITETFSAYNCSEINGWLFVVLQSPCLNKPGFPDILVAPSTTKSSSGDDLIIADSLQILVKF